MYLGGFRYHKNSNEFELSMLLTINRSDTFVQQESSTVQNNLNSHMLVTTEHTDLRVNVIKCLNLHSLILLDHINFWTIYTFGPYKLHKFSNRRIDYFSSENNFLKT